MSANTQGTCRCLLCFDYGDRDRLDSVDTKLMADVVVRGWGVIAVPADDISAGWAFTVGLRHSFQAPEIAMFGLDPSDMFECVSAIGELIVAGGRAAAGDEFDDFLEGEPPLVLREVDKRWYSSFFGAALGFYRVTTPVVPFLQLTWPLHEDEPEDLQPQLWLAPNQHPRGPWTTQL